MGLLDDLKKEAETLQSQELERTQSLRGNTTQVDQALRKVFHYMSELFKQLNVVKPACVREYDLPGVGKLTGLAQSEYRIDYRTVLKDNKDHYESLSVTFKRGKPEQFEVKREAEQIERFRDMLWQNNLRFTSEPFRNDRRVVVYENFRINCEIVCGAEIVGDYEQGVIRFNLKNIEGFGGNTYTLDPSSVEDRALEELAKLFLGKTESGLREFNRRPTVKAPPPGVPARAAAKPTQYVVESAPPAEAEKKGGLFGSLKSALKTDLTTVFKKPSE